MVDGNAIDLTCVLVDAGIGAVGACQFARDGGNVRSGSDACHKVEGCEDCVEGLVCSFNCV